MFIQPLLIYINDEGVLPFISEECINPGILPLICMHSGHIYQFREILSIVRVSAEEPGIHLGRPAKLQVVLGTTYICLEATHSQRINHSFTMHMRVLLHTMEMVTVLVYSRYFVHISDSRNEFCSPTF